MGVVRDVTVDNLVTAVGNIDTSSLAQDSTLQDVVTAIGNISGGNDPVTNTTVNSLCKDTTGQSIASAISGLGATLGANKADIDGGNIASPATFRQNIGCEWEAITDAISDPNSNIESVIFKKCNGVVYISLTTAQKTYSENNVLFTITNSDLIPVENQRLICWSYAADKSYAITVKKDGTVDCYGRGSITGRLIFNGFYFTD